MMIEQANQTLSLLVLKLDSHLWLGSIARFLTGLKQLFKLIIHPQHVISKNSHSCWRGIAAPKADDLPLCSINMHSGEHIKNVVCPVEKVSGVIYGQATG